MLAGSHHRAEFRFADGIEQSIDVPVGGLVLNAAIAADMPMLHQCRSGTCGTCAARLVAGEAPMWRGASVLTADEIAGGQRLLCRTELAGDARFELSYESSLTGGGPRRARAFVDAVERIAADTLCLKLELAEGDWLDFRPGQYVQIEVPGTDVRRSYSIASSPSQLPRIELLVRLIPGGVMSEWLLSDGAVDAVVTLEGPFGSFYLRDQVGAVPHIMIAGGTGLAPFMAMIDVLRARPGRKPPVLVSFGCATREALFYRDELSVRTHWMPGLELRTSIDNGDACAEVRIGNAVSAIQAEDVLNPDTVAYLCGPPGMIAAGRKHLRMLGIAESNIHAEQFVAST